MSGIDGGRLQFPALYLTRFAGRFGFVTVVTLLPTYIELLGVGGVTIGLFVTVLELARTGAIVPLSWAGDRYDKRTVLVALLALGGVVYAAFAGITTTTQFLGVRALQGIALIGPGIFGLALLSELAPAESRASYIGTYNSVRFAAAIAGTLGAGALYQLYGFEVVFGLLAALSIAAAIGVGLFVRPDDSSVGLSAFADLAVNEQVITLTSFRAQYAVSLTLVRNWFPILVGVSVARGGLGHGALVVGTVVAAEKLTNMLCQPYTGRLSDRYGRTGLVIAGGGAYGLVALAVPVVVWNAAGWGVTLSLPVAGTLDGPVLAAVALNGLLGVVDAFREPASMALFADESVDGGIASSFGVRSLVWRPGSVLAPLVGGWLMATAGIQWVFVLAGVAALSGVVTLVGVQRAFARRRDPAG